MQSFRMRHSRPLKRYPIPIYPGRGFNEEGPRPPGPYNYYGPEYYRPGYGPPPLVRYDVLGSTYGSCDCSISSGYPSQNNCQAGGIPVCVSGGCTCYNPMLRTSGCFDERGATC